MTTTRDALRALDRMQTHMSDAADDLQDGSPVLAQIREAQHWGKELAAILQQMDSDPTVAQLQRTIDELSRTGLRLVAENEALRRSAGTEEQIT
jgi:hypothetical protein